MYTRLCDADTTAEGQGEESGSAAGTNVAVVAGITVAVMLLLFVVMVAVAVWWMWRRHWTLPCAAGPYGESGVYCCGSQVLTVSNDTCDE